ncbi:MAG TPA: MarR family winged helix-turn-helix transcriptional regulator [Gemmatimonadaceae bacterium]|jgi:DNA-binding MarR family transcriptional regulator
MVKSELQRLRGALLDLTAVLSSPRPDAALIAAAGVDLDRALFPLLMRVEHRESIGVVELAQISGRDYTTVSRQVTRLEELGLVSRRPSEADRRQHVVALTKKGQTITRAIDLAREQMLSTALENWDRADLKTLSRLLRRFADDALAWAERQAEG